MRAFGQMRHEHQPWLCAVEHMVTLKLLHSHQHCPLACICRATADAILQDQRYLRHRDFCKRILPAIPRIIDVETMNEVNARCHHLFRVTKALENHRCIACGHDRPVLEPLALLPPYLYAPLAMKPCNRSCEMPLAGKIRRAASHSAWLSPRWEFESCICSCGGT